MKMSMSIPFPLQRSQLQRLAAPPPLRRALLCCVTAFVVSLLLWVLSAVWHAEAEAERNSARAGTQKIATLLTNARKTETARAARAKRFVLVKAALENLPPEQSEWERLASQLSAHPHIVESILNVQSGQATFSPPGNLPLVVLQRIQIEAGLLHEEALLALDAIATGSPSRVIPVGCSLRRENDTAPITLRAHCEFDRVTLVPSPERT